MVWEAHLLIAGIHSVQDWISIDIHVEQLRAKPGSTISKARIRLVFWLWSSVADPDSVNPYPDPTFQHSAENFFSLFWIKNCNLLIPRPIPYLLDSYQDWKSGSGSRDPNESGSNPDPQNFWDPLEPVEDQLKPKQGSTGFMSGIKWSSWWISEAKDRIKWLTRLGSPSVDAKARINWSWLGSSGAHGSSSVEAKARINWCSRLWSTSVEAKARINWCTRLWSTSVEAKARINWCSRLWSTSAEAKARFNWCLRLWSTSVEVKARINWCAVIYISWSQSQDQLEFKAVIYISWSQSQDQQLFRLGWAEAAVIGSSIAALLHEATLLLFEHCQSSPSHLFLKSRMTLVKIQN